MGGCHVQPEQMFNLIFGYNSGYIEEGFDLSAPAGTVTKDLSTVPSGEVWVICAARAINNSRLARCVIVVHDAAGNYTLQDQTTTASQNSVVWSGALPVAAGSNMRFYFQGTTLNDDLYYSALGYKMKLSQ